MRASGYAVDGSVTSVTINRATMTIFYTSLSSALEHAIWQIWNGKVRARDVQDKQKPETIFCFETNL